MEQKKKIKNLLYREFLDKGIITTLTEEQVKEIINNIQSKNNTQAKTLFLILYYTGARPNEVLRIKAKDITKEGAYIKILIQGSKKGLPRTIYLKNSNPLINQIYTYSSKLPQDLIIFYNYASSYERTIIKKDGTIKKRKELSTKVYYYIKKWTTGIIDITPYFLRHNRFSKLSEQGITSDQIMMLKGSRTLESVRPYQHLSKDTAKKIAKRIT